MSSARPIVVKAMFRPPPRGSAPCRGSRLCSSERYLHRKPDPTGVTGLELSLAVYYLHNAAVLDTTVHLAAPTVLLQEGVEGSKDFGHRRTRWIPGGSAADRLSAEARLQSCVAEHGGGRHLARLMYWAVRAGGHPLLPVYWRWGYGWSWPHNYSDERDQEK